MDAMAFPIEVDEAGVIRRYLFGTYADGVWVDVEMLRDLVAAADVPVEGRRVRSVTLPTAGGDS